jgi:putative spermidine/putrescine transport system permease protein
MTLGRGSRALLAAAVVLVLVLVYAPLAVVVISSFSSSKTFGWPPPSYTLHWWGDAWSSGGALHAVGVSVQVGLLSMGLALFLGTLLAFGLSRYRFFGRNSLSLLVILPIALPGIVTGMALKNAFEVMLGVQLGYFTLVVAHATFSVVVVFNNVRARLNQLGGSIEEASMDLGASRWTTFRLVTFPFLRTALLAGGLLAFALSFDEIIVTTFTAGAGIDTLPLWINRNLFRPSQSPVVNVVGSCLILASIIPIYLSQRLSGSTTGGRV